MNIEFRTMAMPTSGMSSRKSLLQLCVILMFCDEISRFPVSCGKEFFRPKVTVGLGNFTCL